MNLEDVVEYKYALEMKKILDVKRKMKSKLESKLALIQKQLNDLNDESWKYTCESAFTGKPVVYEFKGIRRIIKVT